MVIYIDETGDLGFNFLRQRTSRYFVVTGLVFPDCSDLARVTIKFEKFRKSLSSDEIKGKSTPFENKKTLYHLIKKYRWDVYSVIVDKKKIQLERGGSAFYDSLIAELVRKVLENVKHSNKQMTVILDRCKTTLNEVRRLNMQLDQVIHRFPFRDVQIHHANSKREAGLQLVDLFSYGVYQKFECGKAEWYRVFQLRLKEFTKG